ncbi:MAG: T9SS type A sorting domain-containing protein [candidate division KSB1 bacterium]|nr:T9SS type A sorting domain-containing protein [candidate division KSB1 bacterium]
MGTSGYNGPRQVVVIPGGSGLVSTFNNDVRAFDLNTLKVTKVTPVGQKPEDILVVGNRVFVANGGFTGFAEDSTIFVFEDRVLPVEASPGIPRAFDFSPAYPNPFVPVASEDGVRLQLQLPQATEVNVTVYNVLGQRVADLIQQVLPAGQHALRWNGRDMQGRIVSPGVYFIRVKTPRQVRTQRVVVRQALR